MGHLSIALSSSRVSDKVHDANFAAVHMLAVIMMNGVPNRHFL